MLQPDRECGQFRDEAKIVAIADFELNDSQSDAVASCISATKCPDKSSLHLAWGPNIFFDIAYAFTPIISATKYSKKSCVHLI